MRALYRLLLPAERFILDITLAAAVIDGASLWARGVTIDVRAYLGIVMLSAALAAAGLAYRWSGRSADIAAALVCTGLFLVFSLSLATFNYSLLPVWQPPVDGFLAKVDALVGYHWSDMIALAAQYPEVSRLLALIYLSTLPQVALMIVVFGLSGRRDALHTMCLTIVIGATGAIVFWGVFPSIGPSWLIPPPPAADLAAAHPLLGLAWGETQYRIVTHGISHLSPSGMQGLIGFPSFHTVLAFTLIYFARPLRWLFPVVLVVNLLVLPALLIHGSHHLVDIPGGFVTFLAALAGARMVMARSGRRSPAPGSADVAIAAASSSA